MHVVPLREIGEWTIEVDGKEEVEIELKLAGENDPFPLASSY